jgi:hypothetical protein
MRVKVTNLRRWPRRAIWRWRLSARPALRLPDRLFLPPPERCGALALQSLSEGGPGAAASLIHDYLASWGF